MTFAAIPDLDAELRQDEGVRTRPYLDSKGRWACGVGCDLKAHGMLGPDGKPLSMAPWTPMAIYCQLTADLLDASRLVHEHLPWAINLDPIRSRVLVNMMFNMGWGDGEHGLSSFKNTLGAIKAGRWYVAATGMLASKWHRDVGDRARRLAYRIETGHYHMPDSYRRA